MGAVRSIAAGIGGLVGVVGVLVFVLLVEVGGISYRKDCLTNRGTVAQSWTFTWYAPLPFLFRPSETNCIVHAGTRVALNAIGIDTFKPSTAESIAGHFASSTGVNPYWPKLNGVIDQLLNQPPASSMSDHIAALGSARAALARLNPPAPYRATHDQLVTTLTALLSTSQQLQKALLRGDRRAYTRIRNASKGTANNFRLELGQLNQIHSAQ